MLYMEVCWMQMLKYRCSQDMDVILCADNGKENDFPWGEGGFCQAQQANADK